MFYIFSQKVCDLEQSRYSSDLRGYLIPFFPNGPLLFPLRQNRVSCFSLTQALTPTNLKPNPILAFKLRLIPSEKSKKKSFSSVLVHLVKP